MKRFFVICKMILRLFLRDFYSFFFTLAFPVFLLFLFGSIYGNAPIDHETAFGIMDISVPAYSVMVIGVNGLMSLPLTLSGFKEKKIYKRFDATPVGKKQILWAQVCIHVMMTLIGIAILLLLGFLYYHIQIKGSFLSICIGILVSIAALFSIGFLFTAVGHDLKSTSILCYSFYFIMLFLSGATMPDTLFPEPLKTISNLLPMTYAVDLMQGLFLKDTLFQCGMEISVLVILTVISTVIGACLYRKKDWT